MNVNTVLRAAALVLAASSFSACAGIQQTAIPPQPAAPLTTQVGSGLPIRGASWMAKGLTNEDLLYVGNSNGTVNVYDYSNGSAVGVLTTFSKPLGMCSDRSGNVYITDSKRNKSYEYAHGGTNAIKGIDDRYRPYGCSVDPRTGNLAVVNFNKHFYQAGNVVVYPPGSKQPVTYSGTSDDHFTGCAYDDHSDLFIVSENFFHYSQLGEPVFYYLPKRATSLQSLNVSNPHYISGWEYQDVQGLAWDGKYWIVENDEYLDRYDINVDVTYVGATVLTLNYLNEGPIAVYRATRKGEATQVVAALGTNTGKSAADYWAYPAGGNPTSTITQGLDNPYGVAISLGASSR